MRHTALPTDAPPVSCGASKQRVHSHSWWQLSPACCVLVYRASADPMYRDSECWLDHIGRAQGRQARRGVPISKRSRRIFRRLIGVFSLSLDRKNCARARQHVRTSAQCTVQSMSMSSGLAGSEAQLRTTPFDLRPLSGPPIHPQACTPCTPRQGQARLGNVTLSRSRWTSSLAALMVLLCSMMLLKWLEPLHQGQPRLEPLHQGRPRLAHLVRLA